MLKQIVGLIGVLSTQMVLADDMSVLRLDAVQRAKLFNYLETNLCSCGCDMSISGCLHDDPSCTVSPALARTAINQLLMAVKTNKPPVQSTRQQQNRPQIYNYDGGGSYVSDGQCSYVSYGGMSFKNCD